MTSEDRVKKPHACQLFLFQKNAYKTKGKCFIYVPEAAFYEEPLPCKKKF